MQWQGDIDEVYVFMTTLSATTVASHFAGDFWGASAPAMQMVLWLRFAEGTGTSVADSSGSGNGVTGTASGNTWRTSADTGQCIPGYWVSYRVQRLSDPTTPVGTQSFLSVQMTDNCTCPHTIRTCSGAHAHAHALA